MLEGEAETWGLLCLCFLSVWGRPRVQLPATLNLASVIAPVAPGQTLFSMGLPMGQHNLQTLEDFPVLVQLLGLSAL